MRGARFRLVAKCFKRMAPLLSAFNPLLLPPGSRTRIRPEASFDYIAISDLCKQPMIGLNFRLRPRENAHERAASSPIVTPKHPLASRPQGAPQARLEGRSRARVRWIILRDAMLRNAPQDEGRPDNPPPPGQLRPITQFP